jgi:hypothetical protein
VLDRLAPAGGGEHATDLILRDHEIAADSDGRPEQWT